MNSMSKLKKKENETERLNIYMSTELFNLLKEKAGKDYLPVATWVKQFLSKQLLSASNNNFSKLNPLNHGE